MDALPLADWTTALLERLGIPLAARQPGTVDELGAILQRVLEEQAVEHFTLAELAALARFYGTPEGASVMRKLRALNDAVTPALEAAVRCLGPRTSPPASARKPPPGEATP